MVLGPAGFAHQGLPCVDSPVHYARPDYETFMERDPVPLVATSSETLRSQSDTDIIAGHPENMPVTRDLALQELPAGIYGGHSVPNCLLTSAAGCSSHCTLCHCQTWCRCTEAASQGAAVS